MVFQDPLSSLNPRQSVESLLIEPLTVHGLSEADREEFGARLGEGHLAKAAVDARGGRSAPGRRWPSTRTSSPAASGSGSASPGR